MVQQHVYFDRTLIQPIVIQYAIIKQQLVFHAAEDVMYRFEYRKPGQQLWAPSTRNEEFEKSGPWRLYCIRGTYFAFTGKKDISDMCEELWLAGYKPRDFEAPIELFDGTLAECEIAILARSGARTP